jgi:hypothetical protein
LEEANHYQKDYRPNDRVDDFCANAADENKSDFWQEPASDECVMQLI